MSHATYSRWRGTIDVPLSLAGRLRTSILRHELGELDLVYHDKLSRCVDTASAIKCSVLAEDEGPRPWRMGSEFEGHTISRASLDRARHFVRDNPCKIPTGGESFVSWATDWLLWVRNLPIGHAAVGVVTHNRNIQFLYAFQYGEFRYKLYDCDGPDFCSVHVYDQKTGAIAPWGGKSVPKGLYLIRHADTEFGT